jgi:AAHS family 4-hydroxybenzoate transporter-like MFS transporter
MASGAETINVEQQIDAQPMSVYQMWVVFFGALILFIDGLDVQLVSYIGPKILTEWSISRTLLGTIFSSMIWGLLIGFAFVAPLSIRFGHRPLVILNMVLFGLATMMAYFVHDPTTMIALRVVAGIGLGGALPSGVALTGEYGPKRLRSTCIALIYCGYSLGTIAAGLLAGALLERYGWRLYMVAGGLIPIAIAVFLYFTLPESLEYLISKGAPRMTIARLTKRLAPAADIGEATMFTVYGKRETALAVAQLFQNGRTLGTLMLWAALFMNLMVIFFVLQWLPSIFTMVGYTQAQATTAATWATGGGILAALILGPLMDWFGPYRVIMVLFMVGGAFLFFTGLSVHSAAILATAVAFVAMGCTSGIQKCINALMVFFYPTALRSTGLGWAFGVGRFGAMLGPILAGFLFDRKWPVDQVFDVYAIPMIIGGLAILVMYLTYREPKNAMVSSAVVGGMAPASRGSR